MVEARFWDVPMKRTERMTKNQNEKERESRFKSPQERKAVKYQAQSDSDEPLNPFRFGKDKGVNIRGVLKRWPCKDHEGKGKRRSPDDQDDQGRNNDEPHPYLPLLNSSHAVPFFGIVRSVLSSEIRS